MSGEQKLASILIAYHLMALGVMSIPDPRVLPDIAAGTSVARRPGPLTLPLDRAATGVAFIEPALYRLVEPIRFLTQPYIAAGVGTQQWYMFSSPYTNDVYLRADAHVARGDERQPSQVYRELLLPADNENQPRLFHRYRDKAILNILESASSDQLRGDRTQSIRRFEPIARFYRSDMKRQLTPADRVGRIELWYGIAPIPGPGETADVAKLEERMKRLAPYRTRSAMIDGAAPARHGLGVTEREADVIWTLAYIDQP